MPLTGVKPKSAGVSSSDAAQEPLASDLQGIKAEIESQRRQHAAELEAIRAEMKQREERHFHAFVGFFEELRVNLGSLRAEINSIRTEMQLRDEKQTQLFQALAEKTDLRERLAVLEERAKRSDSQP